MHSKVQSRLLFTTHYHWLVNSSLPALALFHLAYDEDSNEDPPKITFLYKFIQGVAKSSFGVHVGAMAGLPNSVLSKARSKS